MECHKCEHRAAVEAGKFRGMAFEDTPCAFCEGPADVISPVSFSEDVAGADAVAPGVSVPEQAAFDEEPPAEVSSGALYPVAVLAAALSAFLALSDVDLRMLRLRRRGLSYDAIASALGVSSSALSKRCLRIFERHPLLACLFPSRCE